MYPLALSNYSADDKPDRDGHLLNKAPFQELGRPSPAYRCLTTVNTNAWTEQEMKKYKRYAEKRRQMEEIEEQNIDALLGHNEPSRAPGSGRPVMPRGY